MKSLNVENLEHRELVNRTGTEKFSLSAALSDLVGFKDVFIHHEVLPPGRRASSSHAHSHREEMIFVLRGTPTAFLKGKSMDLRPGDFIGFPPGSDNFRFVENRTEQDVTLLVIASNPKEDRVIYEGKVF